MPGITPRLVGQAVLSFAVLTAPRLRAAPPPSPKPAICVKLINQPVVPVDRATGTGTKRLLLTNQLNTPATLDLTGAFEPTLDSHTLVEFAPTEKGPPSPIFHAVLAPHADAEVFLFVKDDWSDGQQDIALFNHFGVETMGKVHVQRVPVSIAPEDPKLEYTLVHGETTQIVLKNDSPITYSDLHWRLTNGREICGDKNGIDFGAKSTTILNCTPDLHWYWPVWWTNAIKWPGVQGGYRLILFARSPSSGRSTPGQEDQITPLIAIPEKASLDYFHPGSRAFIKYLVTFVVLTLGGIASLLLSYYIPNKLTRIGLKEKLLSLAVRTADLSTRIDSRLAVLVRLERSTLESMLDKRSPLSPDFAAVAVLCTAGLAQLTAKVEILEEMDTILGLLEKRQAGGVPPSRVDEISASLEDANVRLRPSAMAADDIAKARASVGLALNSVNMLNQKEDQFGTALADKCTKVTAELQAVANTPTLKIVLPLVAPAVLVVQGVAGVQVAPEDYVDVDYALNKIQIILRYIRLREGLTDPEVIDRLEAQLPLLIGFLQRKSWAGLKAARLLIREMEDDIYPVRIAEKITESLRNPQSKSAVIEVDPAVIYENAPVDFSLRFYLPEHDTCAAREQFTVEWDFNDGLHGEGWTVSHYFFPRKEPYVVKVRVFDHDAVLINTQGNQTGELTHSVDVHNSALFRGNERTRTEGLKLAVALVIAVIGLLSGAQTQIDKLDLIPGLVAVFLVGFGADSIKRLLTSST